MDFGIAQEFLSEEMFWAELERRHLSSKDWVKIKTTLDKECIGCRKYHPLKNATISPLNNHMKGRARKWFLHMLL